MHGWTDGWMDEHLQLLLILNENLQWLPSTYNCCLPCRPEMKFDGIGALIARIKTDAGIASKQLDTAENQALKAEPFLCS